ARPTVPCRAPSHARSAVAAPTSARTATQGVSVAPATPLRAPNDRSFASPTASVPPARVTTRAATPPTTHHAAAVGAIHRPRDACAPGRGGAPEREPTSTVRGPDGVVTEDGGGVRVLM